MTKITEKSTINFWQPLEIEVDPKFNRLQKALVNIGVFADQYLSLSDYKVSWTSRVESIVGSEGSPVDETVYACSSSSNFDASKRKNTLIKVAKIFSYVILFPLALLALGAKAIYKELYLKPRFNALQQHEIFDIRELHFSTDAMRTIIEELPHWFVGHFTNDKGYCQGIYQLLYCDTQNKSEEEIKELFSKLSNEFVEMLSHAFEKNGITLPRLQLPKNNKTLERGVQWIIHSAWRKTIQMLLDELSRNPKNNLNSFYQLSNAIGDRGIATHDSWNIFQSQLSQRTPEEQEKLKKLIGTPTLCDKRKMTIMGPSFTISIANS